jgi:hypothetical protein
LTQMPEKHSQKLARKLASAISSEDAEPFLAAAQKAQAGLAELSETERLFMDAIAKRDEKED